MGKLLRGAEGRQIANVRECGVVGTLAVAVGGMNCQLCPLHHPSSAVRTCQT